ncbi:hypothetical protein GOC91_16810 [Sinorhizobium medicae]|nr:hypothetical protein [Sinorhizobium medicae]MDX0880561.1 hypothetical protein [Sinorhizobium medicae]MDX1226003.1 hypothetical protein [Sinorhizobium medicae]
MTLWASELDRSLKILTKKVAIGAAYTTGGSHAGIKLDQAARLDRHDVNVTACLCGVVYEDDTKEDFK